MAPKNQQGGAHKKPAQQKKPGHGGAANKKKPGPGAKKKKPGIRAAPKGSPPHGPEEILADTIFDQFDKVKHDGKLDKAEVKLALESFSAQCGVKTIPPFAVGMAIRLADKNGDGTLNKQEFRALVKKLSKYASFPDEAAAKNARAHPSDDESDDASSSEEESEGRE
ncbi:hypothetical protein FVE85_8454 [Porphyridium purpureum]|uniref:EF-hand domain-containing protein n=1 Tax=Porphyridium purpureum TaxID=35688 RepID=A0A5J4YLT8_PORPP|nr:hypothetical protein FVE85_8454 [Porphyridium purpureum]|eukprot:POR7828..scf244_11